MRFKVVEDPEMSNMDWSTLPSLLQADSPIPTDVKFKVMDGEGGEVGEVEAHRLLLAANSQFLQKAFFGSGTQFKEAGCDFENKETTRETFTDMVNYVYEQKIEFGERGLEELCAILNLATMYEVVRLKEVVGRHIVAFPITLAKVVEVAAAATDLAQFRESEELFRNCGTFVSTNFSSVAAFIQFVRSNQGDPTTVVKLIQAIPTLSSSSSALKVFYLNPT